MSRQAHLVRLGVLLLVAVVGVFGYSASAFAETRTFTPEDSEHSFEVPADVYTINVEAIGGAGGQAIAHQCSGECTELEAVECNLTPRCEREDAERKEARERKEAYESKEDEQERSAPVGNGGSGAKVIATLDVLPGENMVVHFGGGGGAGSFGREGGYATAGEGGGASELLSGTSTPLIVAGGGGGAGHGNGGNAEAFVGGNGEGAGAGKGGTLSEGGAGGGEYGNRGERGQGGHSFGGGGGGGGYYGGGGGGFGASGGAGSSFIAPDATGTAGSGAGLGQEIRISFTPAVEETPTTTSSTPSGAIVVGQSETDSVFVTGDQAHSAPTGGVRFFACAQGMSPCASGGTQVGGTVALSTGPGDQSSALSASFTPSEGPGTYCFRAEYEGSREYLPSSDGSTDGCFTVGTAVQARCTANTGTITLSPGLTVTPTVQTMKIKGTLTGCVGESFTAVTYTATLKTAAPVSCSVLQAGGETATGAATYKWTPQMKASRGTINLLLTETPGIALSGAVTRGSYSPLTLSGTVSESYTGAATCSTKKVRKGTFSGSAVNFE